MSENDSNSSQPAIDPLFRDLFASLPDGVLVVEQAGVIRYANPAAQQLFSKTEYELIGAPLGIPIKRDGQPEIELPGIGDVPKFV